MEVDGIIPRPISPETREALVVLKEPLEAIARCLHQLEEHVRILAAVYPALVQKIEDDVPSRHIAENQRALNDQIHQVKEGLAELSWLAIRLGKPKEAAKGKGIEL